MIIYEASKVRFLQDVDERDIEEVILQSYFNKTQRKVGKSEIRSWRDSLTFVAKVLRDKDIPENSGVAVEYHIPQTSKRIDVTVSGLGSNGEKNAVIIELKQWESAQSTGLDAIVRTYVGGAVRDVAHPSYQAWSYASILESFNEAVYEGGIKLSPCAYLHNYHLETNDGLTAPCYQQHIERAPVFLKGEAERDKLRSFIKKYIKSGDNGSVLYELDAGKIRPSKVLADSLKGMIKGKHEFILIDDQKLVYEEALSMASVATEQKPKVLIVEGGPGTGKTVLAINLLVALTGKGLLARYVSKNAAPREVYKSKLTGTIARTKFDNLFSGSGSYISAEKNAFDVLVVDEAHRLNEKSGLYGNLGEHQIKELINASKMTIFFIDEDQRVTMNDVGSKEEIMRLATEKSAEIKIRDLPSQFRCNGSDGYLAWLDNALEIRETANDKLSSAEYDFRIFFDPEEMHKTIESLNGNNRARVVAGYCWPWLSKKNPESADIVIGEYKKQWNLGSDGSLWIISPTSVNQIGCIHTCQGLELDYVGVIIGPDMVVREGKIITFPERRSSQDKAIKGYKTLLRSNPDDAREKGALIVKNTYRTLMTRGLKGCFVYSEDEETRSYFESLIGDH